MRKTYKIERNGLFYNVEFNMFMPKFGTELTKKDSKYYLERAKRYACDTVEKQNACKIVEV